MFPPAVSSVYKAFHLASRTFAYRKIGCGDQLAYTAASISELHTNRNGNGNVAAASSNPDSSPRNSIDHVTQEPAKVDNRASSQLWADVAEEEGEGELARSTSASRLAQYQQQQQEFPSWTGDESVQDAVLRMLVDKYKPLRSGGNVRSAEEKMKEEKVVPPVGSTNAATDDISLEEFTARLSSTASTTTPDTTESVSSPEHKPWQVTFRAPSHMTNVRRMRLPLVHSSKSSNGSVIQIHPEDTRTRNLVRDNRKKAAHAGRLTSAKDSSLDYRLGKTDESQRQPLRPNPVTVKGWASLVEEKIERARNEGQFRILKGRGKPLVRESEASNPFIDREEFLMNRIVQRQGAAPPWVEFQGELESAVSTFRFTLQSTWIRRAVRTLVTSHPQEFLSTLTLADIPMRDPEWEKREEKYHKEAIEDINRLVRKYNGVAPYSVRRAYMPLNIELEKMYKDCREDILEEVRMRGQRGEGRESMSGAAWDDDDEWGTGNGTEGGCGPAGQSRGSTQKFRLLDWWERLMTRWTI